MKKRTPFFLELIIFSCMVVVPFRSAAGFLNYINIEWSFSFFTSAFYFMAEVVPAVLIAWSGYCLWNDEYKARKKFLTVAPIAICINFISLYMLTNSLEEDLYGLAMLSPSGAAEIKNGLQRQLALQIFVSVFWSGIFIAYIAFSKRVKEIYRD